MIKGINLQVIEVNHTDNKYYTKAFLVLNPEYASAQKELLEKEAKKMLKNMSLPTAVKNKHNKNKLVFFLISAFIGACITVAGFLIF